jgi:hypothetical protein
MENENVTKEIVDVLHSILEIVQSRFLGLLVAFGGVLTALAWDDVLKEVFTVIFRSVDTFSGKLLYALLLTAIIFLLTKFVARKKNTHQ